MGCDTVLKFPPRGCFQLCWLTVALHWSLQASEFLLDMTGSCGSKLENSFHEPFHLGNAALADLWQNLENRIFGNRLCIKLELLDYLHCIKHLLAICSEPICYSKDWPAIASCLNLISSAGPCISDAISCIACFLLFCHPQNGKHFFVFSLSNQLCYGENLKMSLSSWSNMTCLTLMAVLCKQLGNIELMLFEWLVALQQEMTQEKIWHTCRFPKMTWKESCEMHIQMRAGSTWFSQMQSEISKLMKACCHYTIIVKAKCFFVSEPKSKLIIQSVSSLPFIFILKVYYTHNLKSSSPLSLLLVNSGISIVFLHWVCNLNLELGRHSYSSKVWLVLGPP